MSGIIRGGGGGRVYISSFRHISSFPYHLMPCSHLLAPPSSSSSICFPTTTATTPVVRHFSRRFCSSSSPPLTTALHDYQRTHLKGRMVDFGGWSLPVSFGALSLIESHRHTRTSCSVFDVSHMGQIRLTGKDRIGFLEHLVVAEIKEMAVGQSKLTLFTNPSGGIIDDAIVSVQNDYLHLVLNAACRDKDIEHIRQQMNEQPGLDVQLSELSDMSLLALQGPKAMDVLAPHIPDVDLHQMAFMTCVVGKQVAGIDGCTVTRCGYTGEDGFEISVPNTSVVSLYKLLLADPTVLPAGLGPRDTLRLEAGLCLYGHDMDGRTSPVQAGLTWTVGKRRRAEKNFLGAETIVGHIADGVDSKRVGILCDSKAVPREGNLVYSKDNEEIGRITSGTFSPTLQKPIAMAYISTPNAKVCMYI
eukprot:GHVS01090716.1.p1 GENE.GHVS01090716.1~~GHVS01090716.1.p1  ORF type:complete len:417 (+),score=84.53 GHVS01090716.1:345-1595(+)